MAFVVTENCIKCKYTDCVAIDCGLCVPECPAEAIYQEDELPEDQKEFTELNAELALVWPRIVEVKPAPADADSWNGVANKVKLIET